MADVKRLKGVGCFETFDLLYLVMSVTFLTESKAKGR